MLCQFSKLFNTGLRAYKVQNVSCDLRVGVTAKCLDDLQIIGRKKLKIGDDVEVTVVLEDDGTVIDSDSVFKQLPQQTVFVFLEDGQTWNGAVDLIYGVFNKLQSTTHRADVAGRIREMMTGNSAPEKISVMSQYLAMLETDIESEDRFEDEAWFDGLSKSCKTKRDVMRNLAHQRIRSYYTSAREQMLKGSDASTRPHILELLEQISSTLKSCDFHGDYFDRTARAKFRLCDQRGWFKCQGPFDSAFCDKLHTINPYASCGHRHLFGLWNLDHVIEKSRVVVPTLLEAMKKKTKLSTVKWNEAYRLLFTLENLKLVQIGCHKKASRIGNKCCIEDFIL